MAPPPHLIVWKRLVDDGQAISASPKVRARLDELERLADNFNAAYADARNVFEERALSILDSLGSQPAIMNWLDYDVGRLLGHDFSAVHLFGSSLPQSIGTLVDEDRQKRFIQKWESDDSVQQAVGRLTEANDAFSQGLDAALRGGPRNEEGRAEV